MGYFGKLWTAALLVLFAKAEPSVACTVFYPTVTVGPSFRVKVADRGRPVQRLQIVLDVGTSAKIHVATDKDGIALFHDVPQGLYHLFADHDAGIPDGADIEVKLAGPSNVTVPLRWPSVTPVVAGSLKGILRQPYWHPGEPQRRISLELLEGISGRKLRSTYTDASGAFDFPGVGSGIYFLRLTAGLIAVAIEPGTTMPLLDLDLGETSCGLQYTNQSECPQADVHTQRLAGRVADETEAAIGNSEILLLDSSTKLVEQALADEGGSFRLLHAANGIYQLIVRENGFTPLRAKLTIDTNSASSPLEVQLSLLGRCSRVH